MAVAADPERAFAALQRQLCALAWPWGEDSRRRRLLIALPSISLNPMVMARHAGDVAMLEHRALYAAFALRRPWAEVAVVTREPLCETAVDYLLGLMPEVPDARERLHLIAVEDARPLPLAELVLDRADVVDRLRALVGPDPSAAFIVPFNVTAVERDLALAIGAPVYGPANRFAALGTKTGSRQAFGACGASHPEGVEGVRDLAGVEAALAGLDGRAAVVKLDDMVYGEGNVIVRAGDRACDRLGGEYLDELARQGGIVEELVEADEIRSPSVQVRVLPDGEPVVISTHDQVLDGHMFVACRFPADPAYSPVITWQARRIAGHLAEHGVVGRFGVDFVVARRAGGDWEPYAVEINLREGGTSHPYGTLLLLTDGSFDGRAGRYVTARGERRHYLATDNLRTPGVRDAAQLVAAVDGAGLGYDPAAQRGVVLHMLGAVATQGRACAVSIGASPADAEGLHAALGTAVA